jgi:hypothetical protein
MVKIDKGVKLGKIGGNLKNSDVHDMPINELDEGDSFEVPYKNSADLHRITAFCHGALGKGNCATRVNSERTMVRIWKLGKNCGDLRESLNLKRHNKGAKNDPVA